MKIEIHDSLINTPTKATDFALNIKQRIPELEHLIIKDPWSAYRYASFLGKRWLEAESIIATKAISAYHYAREIIKGPWKKGEEAISKAPAYSFPYITDILKMRWPKAELYLKSSLEGNPNNNYWINYLRFLKRLNYTKEIKLQWLEIEGITDNLIEILAFLGTSRDIQDYIIRRRPDLINRLRKLRPEIQKKYSHELSLSGIEI